MAAATRQPDNGDHSCGAATYVLGRLGLRLLSFSPAQLISLMRRSPMFYPRLAWVLVQNSPNSPKRRKTASQKQPAGSVGPQLRAPVVE